jgi:hypothetical protein
VGQGWDNPYPRRRRDHRRRDRLLLFRKRLSHFVPKVLAICAERVYCETRTITILAIKAKDPASFNRGTPLKNGNAAPELRTRVSEFEALNPGLPKVCEFNPRKKRKRSRKKNPRLTFRCWYQPASSTPVAA